MNHSLADLIYRGEYDRAVAVALDLSPEAIRRLVLRDDQRHLHDERPADEFLRRWYTKLPSAYARAEAADVFADAFTVELAPVPNGEYIGANWRTESIRELLSAVSKAMLGREVNDWTATPEKPLPDEYAEKWRAAGRTIAGLDLPPVVPPVAPPE